MAKSNMSAKAAWLRREKDHGDAEPLTDSEQAMVDEDARHEEAQDDMDAYYGGGW